ncbi:hypothetical protein EVAR_67584_1 [Eumeta japonica]|uniref:Uncharacterized protein n=1 Tax=Eumeta variegata TaxID=151549 RepID=A0A4C2A8H3_EUMVA|nr:hypothetical protein EVAR_67584_1 [Eumeta japonica]
MQVKLNRSICRYVKLRTGELGAAGGCIITGTYGSAPDADNGRRDQYKVIASGSNKPSQSSGGSQRARAAGPLDMGKQYGGMQIERPLSHLGSAASSKQDYGN